MHLVLLGNTLLDWAIGLCITLAVTVLIAAFKAFAAARLALLAGRTASQLDDLLLAMLGATSRLFIVIVAFYLGALFLELSDKSELLLRRTVLAALLVQLALWGDKGMRTWLADYRRRRAANDLASTTSTAALSFVARMVLWIVAALMILENLGVNVTTLVASLGIGGIAIALAGQNILGDVFASLSIVLDKPFVVGDFIIVDNVRGTVEYVGMKTTRIRSLDGEQVVCSNAELLKSRIHNHKRMQSRRVAFTIGVTYQSTAAQLRAIPDVVRELVLAQPDTRFERAHFARFGASSLDIDIVYHVDNPDFNFHMDVQQAINLGLYERFAQDGIAFAYPTQTLLVSACDIGAGTPGAAPAGTPRAQGGDAGAPP